MFQHSDKAKQAFVMHVRDVIINLLHRRLALINARVNAHEFVGHDGRQAHQALIKQAYAICNSRLQKLTELYDLDECFMLTGLRSAVIDGLFKHIIRREQAIFKIRKMCRLKPNQQFILKMLASQVGEVRGRAEKLNTIKRDCYVAFRTTEADIDRLLKTPEISSNESEYIQAATERMEELDDLFQGQIKGLTRSVAEVKREPEVIVARPNVARQRSSSKVRQALASVGRKFVKALKRKPKKEDFDKENKAFTKFIRQEIATDEFAFAQCPMLKVLSDQIGPSLGKSRQVYLTKANGVYNSAKGDPEEAINAIKALRLGYDDWQRSVLFYMEKVDESFLTQRYKFAKSLPNLLSVFADDSAIHEKIDIINGQLESYQQLYNAALWYCKTLLYCNEETRYRIQEDLDARKQLILSTIKANWLSVEEDLPALPTERCQSMRSSYTTFTQVNLIHNFNLHQRQFDLQKQTFSHLCHAAFTSLPPPRGFNPILPHTSWCWYLLQAMLVVGIGVLSWQVALMYGAKTFMAQAVGVVGAALTWWVFRKFMYCCIYPSLDQVEDFSPLVQEELEKDPTWPDAIATSTLGVARVSPELCIHRDRYLSRHEQQSFPGTLFSAAHRKQDTARKKRGSSIRSLRQSPSRNSHEVSAADAYLKQLQLT